ncbi:hypothetical protein GUJ93_ZPchr0003g17723 [Zizania palustris]|uniref:Uncharacterized protein n=1 Tax=Zizania palustris TaxID=103762 RepID=A0A8J5V7G8_ZIZPA|nr:hypothetical protein GUJ93_ZPchr0003g17723 [Zizania palustris]
MLSTLPLISLELPVPPLGWAPRLPSRMTVGCLPPLSWFSLVSTPSPNSKVARPTISFLSPPRRTTSRGPSLMRPVWSSTSFLLGWNTLSPSILHRTPRPLSGVLRPSLLDGTTPTNSAIFGLMQLSPGFGPPNAPISSKCSSGFSWLADCTPKVSFVADASCLPSQTFVVLSVGKA